MPLRKSSEISRAALPARFVCIIILFSTARELGKLAHASHDACSSLAESTTPPVLLTLPFQCEMVIRPSPRKSYSCIIMHARRSCD